MENSLKCKTKSRKAKQYSNCYVSTLLCFREHRNKATEHRHRRCCFKGLQTNVHTQLSTGHHNATVTTMYMQLSKINCLKRSPKCRVQFPRNMLCELVVSYPEIAVSFRDGWHYNFHWFTAQLGRYNSPPLCVWKRNWDSEVDKFITKYSSNSDKQVKLSFYF